jgi:hypothetical protein
MATGGGGTGEQGGVASEAGEGAKRAPPPFIAMPYPLDEYLDELPGDYGKIARRLLRTANWERGRSRCGRYELDAGEALMDERSEKLWGGLHFDRGDLSDDARRALVRRTLERLEHDGWIERGTPRRAAQGNGPEFGPRNGPRRGPTPTVVRFLKFREILWPASIETAQASTQHPAQETAQANGPILPGEPPRPPVQPEKRSPSPPAPAARRERQGGTTPQAKALEHWDAKVWPALSTSSPPKPTAAARTLLARRCKAHGLEEVTAAMDRARERVDGGDAWLLANLTLQVFLADSQFPKFLPRARAAAPPPVSADPNATLGPPLPVPERPRVEVL